MIMEQDDATTSFTPFCNKKELDFNSSLAQSGYLSRSRSSAAIPSRPNSGVPRVAKLSLMRSNSAMRRTGT